MKECITYVVILGMKHEGMFHFLRIRKALLSEDKNLNQIASHDTADIQASTSSWEECNEN